MTLADWLNKLQAPRHDHIELGLTRIKEVASRLEIPSTFSANVITVAGTNGKGSSVACLESLYHHAGYQVASYTSPHLHSFNERIKINREPVDDHDIVSAFEAIDAARQNTHLTYFEFSTLAAFLMFHQKNLDVIIIEIGIGGRLDCCNIIDPDISLITSIDLDHMEYLGDDRESIGREKAGIMRAGKPVVCADNNPPHSISDCAKAIRADLYCVKSAFQTQSTIHPTNLAGVKKVVELMQEHLPLSEQQFQSATATLKLPGRQELVHHHCDWIFDVAHNPASVKYLYASLSNNKAITKTIAIFHMLDDKLIVQSISHIAPLIDEWHLIPIDSPRASKTGKLLQSIEAISSKPCYNHHSVTSAVDQVLRHTKSSANSSDRVVVFGSFLTVAAVRPLVTSGECNGQQF